VTYLYKEKSKIRRKFYEFEFSYNYLGIHAHVTSLTIRELKYKRLQIGVQKNLKIQGKDLSSSPGVFRKILVYI